MNSTDPRAYSTTDETVLAAFYAARDAEREFARKVMESAAQIGKNKGALKGGVHFGQGFDTVGLAPDDPENPPTGWVYSKSRDCLVPARGKAGDGARAWLKFHQPPKHAHVRDILAEHGLPLNDFLGSGAGGTRRFSVPAVGEYEGTLWAFYRGTPGYWYNSDPVEPTAPWVRRKLSEFYAAEEAAQEAEAAANAAREQVTA